MPKKKAVATKVAIGTTNKEKKNHTIIEDTTPPPPHVEQFLDWLVDCVLKHDHPGDDR